MVSRRYKDISTNNRDNNGRFWRHEIDSSVVDLRNAKNLRQLKEERAEGIKTHDSVSGVHAVSVKPKPVQNTNSNYAANTGGFDAVQKNNPGTDQGGIDTNQQGFTPLDEEEYVRNYLENVRKKEEAQQKEYTQLASQDTYSQEVPRTTYREKLMMELASFDEEDFNSTGDTDKAESGVSVNTASAQNPKSGDGFNFKVELIPTDNVAKNPEPVRAEPEQDASSIPASSRQDLSQNKLFQSYPGYKERFKVTPGSFKEDETLLDKLNPDKVLASTEGSGVEGGTGKSVDAVTGDKDDSKDKKKKTDDTKDKELFSPFLKVFIVISVVLLLIILIAFSTLDVSAPSPGDALGV